MPWASLSVMVARFFLLSLFLLVVRSGWRLWRAAQQTSDSLEKQHSCSRKQDDDAEEQQRRQHVAVERAEVDIELVGHQVDRRHPDQYPGDDGTGFPADLGHALLSLPVGLAVPPAGVRFRRRYLW